MDLMKVGELTVAPLYESFGRPISERDFFLETFFRPDKIWLADEAIVEFDSGGACPRERIKCMAVGIGKIEDGDLDLVEWCLYATDSVGSNDHWGHLIEYTNLALLSQDIYGCDIYVCNRLWPYMFDDLESKRNNGHVLDGLSRDMTSIKIADALRHICWCERYGGHYMEKQEIGQITRDEILEIKEEIAEHATEHGLPYYAPRSEYM